MSITRTAIERQHAIFADAPIEAWTDGPVAARLYLEHVGWLLERVRALEAAVPRVTIDREAKAAYVRLVDRGYNAVANDGAGSFGMFLAMGRDGALVGIVHIGLHSLAPELRAIAEDITHPRFDAEKGKTTP